MLLYLSIPFITLLAAIALMPFIHRRWWERYYWAVSIILGVIVGGYYLITPQRQLWLHSIADYLGFMILLGSLYIVSGGIVIEVGRAATPLANTLLLLAGAVISNIFGTTGASMLLIRPLLRMNQQRLRAYHVVFFIFIVSNTGGLLTPIGDPPLFLGYLRGVPFWWNLQNCHWVWILVVGVLLAIFFLLDALNHRRQPRPQGEDAGPPLRIMGIGNFLFIAAIVWAVFQRPLWRESIMVLACGASWLTTPRSIHQRNAFTWKPIVEVALLFLGIFATMVPLLELLRQRAGQLAPRSSGQYYFLTGGLSAVLDNAPTYLVFLELAGKSRAEYLLAISLASVLFGALTYIGNGPNFMVKSIADSAGVKMPNFIGYIVLYSLPILLPLYVLVWVIFLR